MNPDWHSRSFFNRDEEKESCCDWNSSRFTFFIWQLRDQRYITTVSGTDKSTHTHSHTFATTHICKGCASARTQTHIHTHSCGTLSLSLILSFSLFLSFFPLSSSLSFSLSLLFFFHSFLSLALSNSFFRSLYFSIYRFFPSLSLSLKHSRFDVTRYLHWIAFFRVWRKLSAG